MKIKKIVILLLVILVKVAEAQIPSIQWQKTFGGSLYEVAYCIEQTSDGGYIVAGEAGSTNGDVTGNHGGYLDVWVIKLDSLGNLQWEKCFGGSGVDRAFSIQQTPDGGYIFAATTDSNDGDVSGNHGAEDLWVVKLNNLGMIQWQKCLGGIYDDYVGEGDRSITFTSDGGYIVVGLFSDNVSNPIPGYHGAGDLWVVKLDGLGTFQWEKFYGGSNHDGAHAVQQTSDGGYIVVGYTISNDDQVSGYHGGEDIWVVKINNIGSLEWQKCLGGSNQEIGYAVQQTSDGGYIVSGFTTSNDIDVTGYHNTSVNVEDSWIVKINNSGIIQWQKCLGGSGIENAQSIKSTPDGGYIVGAVTTSAPLNGDVECNHSEYQYDYWILKLNSQGSLEWQKCLGGSYNDQAFSIEVAKCGYIVAGSSVSNDGDVTNPHGFTGVDDFWIVKLSGECILPKTSDSTSTSAFFIPNLITPNGDQHNDAFIISGLQEGYTLEIYNRWGEKIYKRENYDNNEPWNGNNISNGIYYYSLYLKDKKQYKGWVEVLN
jgi:gliding motility-associated-like protein